MKKDFRLSKRVVEIPNNAIDEMTQLSKEIEDVSFFSWAKPTTGTPEHIKDAAIKAIKDGKCGGYSESLGIEPLRKAIVKKLQRDNNIPAKDEEVIVTVGAIEGLQSALMAVIDPGDEVILPSPTYATHIQQVKIASGVPVFVPSKEDEGFLLDLEGIRKSITRRTRAILFNTPTNPTGAIVPEYQLRELADIAVENDLMIITDEAYEYFTYDGYRHFSIASAPEYRKNTISCFTFTKTYVMTGWRVGYLHAPEELIPHINKAHIPFAICCPVVSQYAALGALEGPQSVIGEYRKKYASARNLMCSRLDQLKDVFSYQKPNGAYLMFPKILVKEGRDSISFCKTLLKEAKISATPGAAFGPTGEGHVRLSFCIGEKEINKAFDRLEAYFKPRIFSTT